MLKSAIVALAVVLATPAAADTVYSVDLSFPTRIGNDNHITGTITTDGTLGALALEDIVSWRLVREHTSCAWTCSGTVYTNISDSAAGGTVTFTEGYFIATENTLYFDYGPFHDPRTYHPGQSLFFMGPTLADQVLGYHSGCDWSNLNPNVICNTKFSGGGIYVTVPSEVVATRIVPAPVIGTGLPSLMLAALGWLGWWRRRRHQASA
jgi:hypothetical protein